MVRITLGRLMAGILALTAVLGTVVATSAVIPRHSATASPGAGGGLIVYGSRSAAQQRSALSAKLDGALSDIVRHTSLVRPGTELLDLKSLNPAARFMVARGTGTRYVIIDAVTRGDAQILKGDLVKLGLLHPSVYLNDVSGWLPVTAINAATGLAELHSIRAALSRTNTGVVTSQGDYAQGTATLRANNPSLTGAGFTVGVLSDSYDCYAVYAASDGAVPAFGNTGYAFNGFTADAATDISTGDLPPSTDISILEEPGTDTSAGTCLDFGAPLQLPYGDEGRAMMQVVHDVAPGANLAFHTAVEGEADFASGIQALAAAGAQVIADDVIYFDEPFFQDGLVAQAVDTVNAGGVAYFAAAGNNGSNGYDNLAPSFATASTSPANEKLLNFDTSGASTTTQLTVNIPQLSPGDYITVVLEWDQPYVTGAPDSGGATSQMDLCVTGAAAATGLIVSPVNPNADAPVNDEAPTDLDGNTQVCTGANPTGSDAYQILIIGYPANATSGPACPSASPNPTPTLCSAAQKILIQVGLASGAAPGRIKLAVEDDGAGISFPGPITPTGATLQGHPGAAGAMAVGAVDFSNTPACGQTPALLETYSAKGGDPILFDSTGTRLATPLIRQKPDIAGPDGGNNTFLGFLEPDSGSGNCANSVKFPDFFGTSAATPHVAAAGVLLLQKFPGITTSALYTALKSGTATLAADTANGGTNLNSGYGFIQADSALAALPTAPDVTLTLSPTTIMVGASAMLNWTVTNANSCTASGAWSGAQALSGTLQLKPGATGSYTYNLTCTNADGYTEDTDVLTVTAASGGGGGGGGALDLSALLALAGLAGARLRRRRS